MADDKDRKDPTKKGPGSSLMIHSFRDGNAVQFAFYAFNGSRLVPDVEITVAINGSPLLLNAGAIKTGADGKAEWKFVPQAGTKSFKLKATGIKASDTDSFKAWAEDTIPAPEAAEKAGAKSAPRFMSESNNIEPGKFWIHMSLMNPVTFEGVAGRIRLVPKGPVKINGTEFGKGGKPLDIISLSADGELYLIEVCTHGVVEIDVHVVGWPNEKAQLRAFGPKETPIKPNEKSGFCENLFAECR